ncbi:hypothetical protein CR513_41708, partial [Mucuna pruriens]
MNVIPENFPVFDGKGYEDWCMKMDVILGFQELDEIMKDGFQEPSKNASAEQKETHQENKRLDYKAQVLLHQCVSANVFQKISQAATSKQAWDILQQVYGNTGRTKKVKLQSLRRQYELLSMIEQETIADYFNRIQVVTNSMRACDEAMADSKIVEKVLRTLTPSFDHIVVAIEESKDLEKMTVEELQNSLEAHEQRVLERKSNDKVAEQALQARTSHKSRGRGGWNRRGRGRHRGGRS